MRDVHGFRNCCVRIAGLEGYLDSILGPRDRRFIFKKRGRAVALADVLIFDTFCCV